MDHWWGFGSTEGTGSGTIGKQSYVDLNASMLPFSVPGLVKAYDWFTGTPVTLTDAGGGWKKLQKTGNSVFYKVTFTSGPTDVANNFNNRNLQLFPNPVKEVLNIKSDLMIKEVLISNLLGLIVYTSENNSEELSLDLSRFSQGIYVCTIIFENGDSVTRKLIIE